MSDVQVTIFFRYSYLTLALLMTNYLELHTLSLGQDQL